jgi:hypothetical protein
MSPVGITLLMPAAFAGFAWLVWGKLAIAMRLQPEVRWDQPAARLKAVLVNGLLRQRMVAHDWKRGLMHAVIFLGLIALQLRKLQFIAIGHDEPFVNPGLAVAPRSERVTFHDPCTPGRRNGEHRGRTLRILR